jgi:hypothetical protein
VTKRFSRNFEINYREKMNLLSKIVIVPSMLVCLNSLAADLSADLQNACIKDQLGVHKGVKGRPVEAVDFTEYCKCEADLILEKTTKEQLNEISGKEKIKPGWLKQLKTSALKSCIKQKNQIST